MVTSQNRERPENYFTDWKAREELAEKMIPVVGQLYRNNSAKAYVYGRDMVGKSVLDIMKMHRAARQIVGSELSEFETFPILETLASLNLGMSHIDVGRLATNFEKARQAEGVDLETYLRSELSDIIDKKLTAVERPRDIVLYGFGRIGRLLARLLIEKTGGGETLRLRAIVVRQGGAKNDLVKRASLLRRDSVHGSFKGTIRVDEENSSIVANGNEIKVIYSSAPEDVDYTAYGIEDAIVIDNTGVWRDEAGLGRHLQAKGVSKVLLTAPGKGDIKNIVFGVNNADIDVNDTILSAASCTTNAIVPPLKMLEDKFGIENGHVETVHSYTNDQNLIDNYHKGDRRGRSAPLNMVLTETGAAKAVAKVLPQFEGKLTGNAIRVPTPNVSMAILKLNLRTETSVDELNEFMRWAAVYSPLRKQIDFTNSPEVVSTDFVGSRSACVFDAGATIVNGKTAVLYCWYDNEFGYSCQVHRIVEQMAGVNYAVFPRD